jgi:hypothetical protein
MDQAKAAYGKDDIPVLKFRGHLSVNGARRRELTEEHVKQKGIEGETRNKEGRN